MTGNWPPSTHMMLSATRASRPWTTTLSWQQAHSNAASFYYIIQSLIWNLPSFGLSHVFISLLTRLRVHIQFWQPTPLHFISVVSPFTLPLHAPGQPPNPPIPKSLHRETADSGDTPRLPEDPVSAWRLNPATTLQGRTAQTFWGYSHTSAGIKSELSSSLQVKEGRSKWNIRPLPPFYLENSKHRKVERIAQFRTIHISPRFTSH